LEATTAPEIRTRYGRAVRAPVRYEPVEKVEDDYGSDDYDEEESDVCSGVEFSDSELEDDDDSDLDGFVVPDRDESDVTDNGSDSDSDASSSGVHAPVAGAGAGTPARKVPATKVPVRGKK
jgi:hypothetical protein